MLTLDKFRKRHGGMGKEDFLKKFPLPMLLVRIPGAGSGTCDWVFPVENRADEGIFKEEISIGRSADNDIVIEVESVSKNHAQLSEHEGAWQVVDLNSKNGTTMNGLPLAPFAAAGIRSGGIVGLGGQARAAFYTPDEFWASVLRKGENPFKAGEATQG